MYSEFCDKENVLQDVSKEEIPTEDKVDYMLSPPTVVATGDEASGEEPKSVKMEDTGYLVYCIDISGSMNVTTELPQIQCKSYLHKITIKFRKNSTISCFIGVVCKVCIDVGFIVLCNPEVGTLYNGFMTIL